MTITEDTEVEDVCTVVLVMLVQKFTASSSEGALSLDYVMSVDTVTDVKDGISVPQNAMPGVRITKVESTPGNKPTLSTPTPTDPPKAASGGANAG